eukprot:INCI17276.2.p1 GENE.INCI17276.2~~INCI17276.2.p1  ORF type:complete len:611 (+),score=87.20 INCI17276.2:290-2122(+)
MLPHRRSTLTFLRQTDENSAPIQQKWEETSTVKYSRSLTPKSSGNAPRSQRRLKRYLSLGTAEKNKTTGDENAAPKSVNNFVQRRHRGIEAKAWSATKKPPTPNYRQNRRLVKRNTIGAPSRSSSRVLQFGPECSEDTTENAFTRGTPVSSSTRTSRVRNALTKDSPTATPTQNRRRSSGAFMVDVRKRKVIDASPSAGNFAPGHLTSDTFSDLESMALSNVKLMLHLRYSGGDIPQDHPLFNLDRIDPAGWDTAMRQFNSMERTADKVRQVVLFQNCIRAISTRCAELHGGTAAGADMLLPALIYVLMNSNIDDLTGLYKQLRSARPSAVAKFYNRSQLEPVLARMDLKTLRSAWTQVQQDANIDNEASDCDEDFNIELEDLQPETTAQADKVLVLGDETAIRRRMSKVSPHVCRNDIIIQIMSIVRHEGRRNDRDQQLFHSLQNHGILMSCGQICYILTLFESALRFLISTGLTCVLRNESELQQHEQPNEKSDRSGPDIILCTKGSVADSDLVMRHCFLKSKALQCYYHPDGFRKTLLRFYSQHNKGKAGNVDHILKIYKGRERTMFTKLHQKYQAIFFKDLPALTSRKDAARSVRKAKLQRSVTRG